MSLPCTRMGRRRDPRRPCRPGVVRRVGRDMRRPPRGKPPDTGGGGRTAVQEGLRLPAPACQTRSVQRPSVKAAQRWARNGPSMAWRSLSGIRHLRRRMTGTQRLKRLTGRRRQFARISGRCGHWTNHSVSAAAVGLQAAIRAVSLNGPLLALSRTSTLRCRCRQRREEAGRAVLRRGTTHPAGPLPDEAQTDKIGVSWARTHPPRLLHVSYPRGAQKHLDVVPGQVQSSTARRSRSPRCDDITVSAAPDAGGRRRRAEHGGRRRGSRCCRPAQPRSARPAHRS